jgi:hypothetical protein
LEVLTTCQFSFTMGTLGSLSSHMWLQQEAFEVVKSHARMTTACAEDICLQRREWLDTCTFRMPLAQYHTMLSKDPRCWPDGIVSVNNRLDQLILRPLHRRACCERLQVHKRQAIS